MKHSFTLIIVTLFFCGQSAQGDSHTERIRKAAEENSAALVAGNYERVADFTYPKLVEMAGGREKMIEMMQTGEKDMKAHGATVLGAEVSEPKDVVTVGEKQFAIVPITVKLQVPDGTLRSKGFLIAISSNKGKSWTFIDGAGVTKEKLDLVLPDFPKQLSLPEREQPVLEPK